MKKINDTLFKMFVHKNVLVELTKMRKLEHELTKRENVLLNNDANALYKKGFLAGQKYTVDRIFELLNLPEIDDDGGV
jgi:hypothetical protein